MVPMTDDFACCLDGSDQDRRPESLPVPGSSGAGRKVSRVGPWPPDKCVPEIWPCEGTQELGWRQADDLKWSRHGSDGPGGRSFRLRQAVRSLTFRRQGVSVPGDKMFWWWKW